MHAVLDRPITDEAIRAACRPRRRRLRAPGWVRWLGWCAGTALALLVGLGVYYAPLWLLVPVVVVVGGAIYLGGMIRGWGRGR